MEIAITRDRLIENEAFESLSNVVRASLDFYAMREAARELKRAEGSRTVDRADLAIHRVSEILSKHGTSLPKDALDQVRRAVSEATSAVQQETEIQRKQANMLGALATMGMAAAALEHEAGRQLRRLESYTASLQKLGQSIAPSRQSIQKLAAELEEWVGEFRTTTALFTTLLEPESREQRLRLRAQSVLEQVTLKLGALLRGVPVDIGGVSPELRLPAATVVEWTALFQNVLVNAVNASLDAKRRQISVSSASHGLRRSILVQDTGAGVDLTRADELFQPFVRRLKLSPARQGLGIGGTGMGLTIVRMIATNLGCHTSFVEPKKGFSTAFRLSWSEKA
ncbi:MAG: hypothetical protein IPK67_17320 [Planctomycetes bacterium]|nr:hypothetical protein [Planctomycetota bacterium]